MATKAGKTFYFAAGTQYKEIRDGTSKTILIAEVAPEHAVFWTQPADWEVDLARPLEKLRVPGGSSAIFNFCDGSVRRYTYLELEAESMLTKSLTKDGREVIKY